MRWLEVQQSRKIRGTFEVPGSKNSSLALLAAACLADEPVTLTGIPDVYDTRVIKEILEEVGILITKPDKNTFIVDARPVRSGELNFKKTATFRASYYFVGALLKKCGAVSIGYPGGDDFVSRPIDQHLKLLTAFGARVAEHENYYNVTADHIRGTEIFFDVITCGATIHAVLIAVLASGKTVLKNVAQDPEVVDVCNLLNRMGAKIKGAGTSEITVIGVEQLGGCTYAVIPDRLIAGAMLMTAGIAKNEITVMGAIPEHLASCLSKLEEIGLEFDIKDHSITAFGANKLRPVRIRTGMYPAFATDLQQPISSLLLGAQGRSIIADKIYPYRFNHISNFIRMGAEIKTRTGVALISGGRPLKGAVVHASDVRAGTSLIMAALLAEGKTCITGVEHIERGYEDVVQMFDTLHVDLKMVEGVNPYTQEGGEHFQSNIG
ncbi:UDP-N-acetylglucosamine 1-carboxyvinyltransferase [Paenibacillus sp. PL2-23]|uniref:UDP-N-acetylglucosamine 1-carboxyvinyltransferase n=1 Tax=Paenibacillus sp. PL2-23 TaxID=2100729 RepID=UPI0030F78BB7